MDIPCDFDQQVSTSWQHTIEKVSNIDRQVFPYIDDTRKCIMKMNVTINGQEHYTSGSYVFGPDATENYACEQASIKAKKEIIQKVSPEVLSAKTTRQCVVKQIEEPKEPEVTERVIVQEVPVIQFVPKTGNSGTIQTNPVDKVISSMVELVLGQNNY